MSDRSAALALRSPASLVVIEAPAGCGKTYQGADYAGQVAASLDGGRVLILTHTNAACDVFASRTHGISRRVDIRTIDSLITQITAVYHEPLGLLPDTASWARGRKDGYAELARKASRLLRASPMISQALAQRYPVVICDEHQDASADQHALAMACYEGGAHLRIFGDPMQRIYGSRKTAEIEADDLRWRTLKRQADVFDELDEPHRWANGATALGQWILNARKTLRGGGQVDLRSPLPAGVAYFVAENESQHSGGYMLSKAARQPVDQLVNSAQSLLVLAAQNRTVEALRAFFNRRLPIWEGHVRENLATLVGVMQKHKGNPIRMADATVTFLGAVATGFSPSAYGNAFMNEVSAGCVRKRRGKPATLQELGRIILAEPDHKGVAKVLNRVSRLLVTSDPAFAAVKLDYRREFWDAVRLGEFKDPDEGLAEIARRRTYTRPALPAKAISTIHKAKGLECRNVLIMPCDAHHFGDTPAARSRLYVAMSRATQSLTLVVSRRSPSPLFAL